MNIKETIHKMTSREKIAAQNGYLICTQNGPVGSGQNVKHGTVVNNMLALGFVPSTQVLQELTKMDDMTLARWWKRTEAVLKDITFADRNMSKHVVYQNFPKEVLDMSQAEYWFNQILMYWGAPPVWFQSEPAPRDPLFEKVELKVLHLAPAKLMQKIWQDLGASGSKWSDSQREWAEWILDNEEVAFDFSTFKFKENAVALAVKYFDMVDFVIPDATDVMRVAAALNGAPSLKEVSSFGKINRERRKRLLALLQNSKNLEDDAAARQSLWKAFLRRLHPGDYANTYPKVAQCYDDLYNKRLMSFAQTVEQGVIAKNPAVLDDLQKRPGIFARRLQHMYLLFGQQAFDKFSKIVDQLSVRQLAQIRSHFKSIDTRGYRVAAPKGNWARMRKFANTYAGKFDAKHLNKLFDCLDLAIKQKVDQALPAGGQVDMMLDHVKLRTNSDLLAEYGAGTRFPISDNITFARSASYWENTSYGSTWFDNGWIFLDDAGQSVDVVCWNHERAAKNSAIFSGDPVNANELRGRGCQMIDLYFDKLEKQGVRYAVWNVLCYNNIPFSKVTGEVLATLQLGEEPTRGKLYEPAKAQMQFKLQSNTKTSYIAYIDLETRELVYMDADFGGNVSSAVHNKERLSEKFLAYKEYLEALPSVFDVVRNIEPGETQLLYTDTDHELNDTKAYVFRPANASNTYDNISIEDLIDKV